MQLQSFLFIKCMYVCMCLGEGGGSARKQSALVIVQMAVQLTAQVTLIVYYNVDYSDFRAEGRSGGRNTAIYNLLQIAIFFLVTVSNDHSNIFMKMGLKGF